MVIFIFCIFLAAPVPFYTRMILYFAKGMYYDGIRKYHQEERSAIMKRNLLLLTLVFLVFSLTGCGAQITSVTLPDDIVLEAGEQQTLEITFAAKDGTAQEAMDEAAQKLTLTWTSSDEAVVQVDETGCVTAVAPGEADVTVTAGDDLTASCRVAVIVPLTGIDVPEELQLSLGGEEEAALNASPVPADATGVEVTYSSSDEAVATVDADGTVHAVGMGECVIRTEVKASTGTSDAESESYTGETRVTVETAATGITLSRSAGSLYVGNSANVQVYTSPEEAQAAVASEVKYTSSNESVATVVGTTEGAAAFTVKGVGVGSATITVEYNGLTASYTVSVSKYVAPQKTTSTGGSTAGGSTGGGQATTPAPQPSTPTPDAGGSTGGGAPIGSGDNAAGQGNVVIPGGGTSEGNMGDAEIVP